MSNENLLSQDESPSEIKSMVGVRRVNKLPLIIFAVIMILFVVLMAIVASNRGIDANKKNNRDDNQGTQSSESFANMVARDHQMQGIVPPKNTEITPETRFDPNSIIIERPRNLDLPPVPNNSNQAIQAVRDPYKDQILSMKRQRLEEAIKAKTLVATPSPHKSATHTAAPIDQDVSRKSLTQKNLVNSQMGSFQDRMNNLRNAGYDMSQNLNDPMMLVNDEQVVSVNNDYSQFDSNERSKRWKLGSAVEKPVAKYLIQTGFVIPGIMITGINSELPGQITAQVSQNVYDTPVGKYLLIPQGSKLVGAYNNEVIYGQERVLIAWQRIVFPDGKTLDLGAMPGTDIAGYAGVKDQVNHHYFRIFGSALLMSAIIAGASYSQRDAGNAFGRQNAGSILSQSLGQQLGMTTSYLLRKNLNISPTIEIRPGFKFNVMVTKDIVFNRPYRSFDYSLAAK